MESAVEQADKPGRRWVVPVLLAVLVVIAIARWWPRGDGIDRGRIRNVILISIDTCRADHLGCYGFDKPTTPNLDALAEEGIRFDNVLATAPLTLPAHCSMLTGTIPPAHGVHHNLDYRLDGSNVTLAELLQKAGFRTGGIIGAFVLDAQFGLDQGFDHYDDDFGTSITTSNVDERLGAEGSQRAIDWITRHKDERFFLFLHYFDPHFAYEPPEPFASRFAGDPYAGEIAYTDACIGRVIEKLKELGLYESTAIVVVGDHGEMLGEHGEPDHSFFIYESAVKVPLITRVPGLTDSRVVGGIAGIVDIVPTICDLLSVEIPHEIQGRSLCPLMTGREEPDAARTLYCESLTPTIYGGNSLLGVVSSNWKYIQTTRPELYDLEADPQEQNNLVTVEAYRAQDMQDLLREILDKQLARDRSGQQDVGSDTRRRLETLGYVGGGSISEEFAFDQSREDPKALIDLHNMNEELRYHVFARDFGRAEALAERMVEMRPSFPGVHHQLARIAIARDRWADAIPHLERVIELDPQEAGALNDLGLAHKSLRQYDLAAAQFRRALEVKPDYALAEHNLGLVLSESGKVAEAVEHFRRAVEIDPEYADAYNNLGTALSRLDRNEEALACFQRAVQIAPAYQSAISNLAVQWVRMGELGRAVETYERALEHAPAAAFAHTNLGMLLMQSGRYEEAIGHYERALSIQPDLVVAHRQAGSLLSLRGERRRAMAHLWEANRLEPDSGPILNNIAWLLATSPESDLRDTEQAVALAERAAELSNRQPGTLDTLAAAYAAVGQYEKAVTVAEEALAAAREHAALSALASAIEERLALYRQSLPFIEPTTRPAS